MKTSNRHKRVTLECRSIATMLLCCSTILTLPGLLTAQTPWTFQNETNARLVPDLLAAEDIRTAGQVTGTNPSEWDAATGDVNLDGKMDCVTFRKNTFYSPGKRTGFVLLNVNGRLVDVTRTTCPDIINNPCNARDVELCDVNGDGFPDALVANTFGEDPKLFVNRGNDANGRWQGFVIADIWFLTAQGNTSFQLDTPTAPATVPGMTSCALACCDVDDDGDFDLLLTAYPWTIPAGVFSSEDRILINDGNGRFKEEPNRLNHPFVTGSITTGVECADMDADGDMDYVVSHAIGANVVVFNNGQGVFDSVNAAGTTGIFNYMFGLVHINPDGIPDMYGLGDGQDRTGINLGNGTFSPPQLVRSRATLVVGGNVKPFYASALASAANGDVADGAAAADMDTISSSLFSCTDGHPFTIVENRYVSNNQPHMFDPDFSTLENYEMDGVWDFVFLDVDCDGLNDILIFHCDGVDLFIQQ